MVKTGKIYGINGPVVYIKGNGLRKRRKTCWRNHWSYI